MRVMNAVNMRIISQDRMLDIPYNEQKSLVIEKTGERELDGNNNVICEYYGIYAVEPNSPKKLLGIYCERINAINALEKIKEHYKSFLKSLKSPSQNDIDPYYQMPEIEFFNTVGLKRLYDYMTRVYYKKLFLLSKMDNRINFANSLLKEGKKYHPDIILLKGDVESYIDEISAEESGTYIVALDSMFFSEEDLVHLFTKKINAKLVSY